MVDKCHASPRGRQWFFGLRLDYKKFLIFRKIRSRRQVMLTSNLFRKGGSIKSRTIRFTDPATTRGPPVNLLSVGLQFLSFPPVLLPWQHMRALLGVFPNVRQLVCWGHYQPAPDKRGSPRRISLIVARHGKPRPKPTTLRTQPTALILPLGSTAWPRTTITPALFNPLWRTVYLLAGSMSCSSIVSARIVA